MRKSYKNGTKLRRVTLDMPARLHKQVAGVAKDRGLTWSGAARFLLAESVIPGQTRRRTV